MCKKICCKKICTKKIYDIIFDDAKNKINREFNIQFYKLGFISKSGFKRMNKLMSENGLKWSFKEDSYGFYFTFFRENGTNCGTNGTNELKDLSESEHQIYDLLCSNPRYIREELAKLTNKSARTFQRLLNPLSEKGYINRIGKTKMILGNT